MKNMSVSIKDAPESKPKMSIKKKLRDMGSLSIDDTQLPEVKDWKVGEEYTITIKVRQTSIAEVDKWQIEEYGMPEGTIVGRFDVLSATVPASTTK